MKKIIDAPRLRQLIAQNKTQQVFDELNAAAFTMSDAPTRNQITLLEARWKKLRQDKIKGILSTEAQGLENNRINDNLLTLLDEIENPTSSPVPTQPTPNIPSTPQPTPKKIPWKTIGTAIVTIVGVIAGIAEISGYSIRDWWESKPLVTNDDDNNQPVQKDTVATISTAPAPNRSNTTTQKPITKPTMEEVKEILPLPKAKLQVQIKTQRGDKNLIFKEAEEVQLFFRVNRPCKLRTIYRLADGTLVLLDNDRLVNQPETNQWVQLADGFEVAEPFGAEELYIFAQETDFPALLTYEEDGYTIIQDGLPTALSKTRGLKKKKVFAEDKLNITTQKK